MASLSKRIVIFSSGSANVSAKLIGFKINSAILEFEHALWLDGHVVPLLLSGGSISLLGSASRSGSSTHNLGLSKKRATSVLSYLRHMTGGLFRSRVDVDMNEGVGEKFAAWAGHADGKEDAAYRAVFLVAWNKPVPPPPPKPIQPPVRMLEMVTSRTYEVVNHPGNDRGTIHDGAHGVALAGLFNDALGKNEKITGRDFFPTNWCVIRVHEIYTSDIYRSVAGTSTRYKTEWHYYYGPMQGTIRLEKTDIKIENNGKPKSNTQTFYVPLREIWKRTKRP